MKNAVWHILAVFAIFVWSGSFISTKVLLLNGFSPEQIFCIRFICVYLLLLILSHKKKFADSYSDEGILFLCGLSGATLYYLAENNALSHTLTSNVSIIVCANPLITMIATHILYKEERLNKRQIAGSLIALFGMILVVFNGKFILNMSPFGDMLAFMAAAVWTVYTLALKRLHGKYSVLFINRKVYFYGTVTSLPLLLLNPHVPWSAFLRPVVSLNFLLLCVLASLAGYVVWTKVLEKLGTVFASNYIYTTPLGTILFAAIILEERITPIALAGAVVIIFGMAMAEKR